MAKGASGAGVAYRRYILFERAVILAFATVLCSGLTMVVGIGAFHLSLPPTDGATLRSWFSEPVMTIAGPLCGLCTLIAYPFMLWGLVQTRLVRSLPLVILVSLSSMAVLARFHVIGAVISLVCSITTMCVCRWRFRDTVEATLNEPREPTSARG